MKHFWDDFLIEGDLLYTHMINNFQEMIDTDYIKHFKIRDGVYRHIYDTAKMTEEYGNDIQKELISWIKNELNTNRLFDKTLWKPFRDQSFFSYMYFGYRILFHYKEFIYQLGMQTYCELDECKYCNHTKNNDNGICCENSQHFCLALYGWKSDNSNLLQPYRKTIIPDDNIIPEDIWIHQ
jgi:hypothetical protein